MKIWKTLCFVKKIGEIMKIEYKPPDYDEMTVLEIGILMKDTLTDEELYKMDNSVYAKQILRYDARIIRNYRRIIYE